MKVSAMQLSVLEVLLFLLTVKLRVCVLGFCLFCWIFLFVYFSWFCRVNITFGPLNSSLDFLPCTKEIAPEPTSKSFMAYNSDEHKYAQWIFQ